MVRPSGAVVLALLLMHATLRAEVSEVRSRTHTEVRVRPHPSSGEPLVLIVPEGSTATRYSFLGSKKEYARPDYRMLDHKLKSGEVPYDGPSSDRKKVYLLAASLAAAGLLAGALTPVAATSAAGTGTTGSAGVYVAASSAVTAGTISTAALKAQPDAERSAFTHRSQSWSLDVLDE